MHILKVDSGLASLQRDGLLSDGGTDAHDNGYWDLHRYGWRDDDEQRDDSLRRERMRGDDHVRKQYWYWRFVYDIIHHNKRIDEHDAGLRVRHLRLGRGPDQLGRDNADNRRGAFDGLWLREEGR